MLAVKVDFVITILIRQVKDQLSLELELLLSATRSSACVCVCVCTDVNFVLSTAHGVSLQECRAGCQALQMKSQF